jgi:hypothetical protein
MRRLPIPIAALAVAALAAIAASPAPAAPGPTVTGADGNTQNLESLLAPKRLFAKTLAPAALRVHVETHSVSAPNGVPSPATHVFLDFDRNAALFTKGLPTCDPSLVQSVSTEVAEQACGKAKIGSGTATALLISGSKVYPVEQVVTAFNGVPKGGRPTVILQTYGTTPLQTSLVLIGTVSNYGKEGYGPRLDLDVPLLAGGQGSLVNFAVKIERKWSYKGKKRSFVSAKCPKPKKLKARAMFTYRDGQELTATSTQKCTQRPEPRKGKKK